MPTTLAWCSTEGSIARIPTFLTCRRKALSRFGTPGICNTSASIGSTSCVIDDGVSIRADTTIEPFVQLLGNTSIGENCRIGSCVIIEDSEIGDEVEIGPFTVIGTSKLERGVHAGPFSRLRMENHVTLSGALHSLGLEGETRLTAT